MFLTDWINQRTLEQLENLRKQNVQILANQQTILDKLDKIEEDNSNIMADLSKLNAEVARNTTLVGQAIVAIQQGNDQTGVDVVTSQFKTNNDNLQNALNPPSSGTGTGTGSTDLSGSTGSTGSTTNGGTAQPAPPVG